MKRFSDFKSSKKFEAPFVVVRYSESQVANLASNCDCSNAHGFRDVTFVFLNIQ